MLAVEVKCLRRICGVQYCALIELELIVRQICGAEGSLGMRVELGIQNGMVQCGEAT